MPAFIRKFHEAKVNDAGSVTVWGTGTPRREFCHVDDCAAACLFLMEHCDGWDFVNIGVGEDITIRELVAMVQRAVGFEGGVPTDDGLDGSTRE